MNPLGQNRIIDDVKVKINIQPVESMDSINFRCDETNKLNKSVSMKQETFNEMDDTFKKLETTEIKFQTRDVTADIIQPNITQLKSKCLGDFLNIPSQG